MNNKNLICSIIILTGTTLSVFAQDPLRKDTLPPGYITYPAKKDTFSPGKINYPIIKDSLPDVKKILKRDSMPGNQRGKTKNGSRSNS